jgi:hypothetical protein
MCEKKTILLAKLDKELKGLYMVGALCTSDMMLEHVTKNVQRVLRAKRRIQALEARYAERLAAMVVPSVVVPSADPKFSLVEQLREWWRKR